MKTICFLGHRQFHPRDLEERLSSTIKENISFDEDVLFLMGRHGDYDRLALSVCRQIRKEYPKVKITVVFTSLAILRKPEEEMYSVADMYDDVDTMIYNIEEEHFKNQIVSSNKQMVDDSDIVICYVDFDKRQSGAKIAVKYAQKQNKKVINLFKEQDRPFYGMTEEEKEIEIQRIKNELDRLTKKD